MLLLRLRLTPHDCSGLVIAESWKFTVAASSSLNHGNSRTLRRRWVPAEDADMVAAVDKYGLSDWGVVTEMVSSLNYRWGRDDDTSEQ
jgi:hypothetical protein